MDKQKGLFLVLGGTITSCAVISLYKLIRDYKSKNVKSISSLKPGMTCSIEGEIRNKNRSKIVDNQVYKKATTYTLVKSSDMVEFEK